MYAHIHVYIDIYTYISIYIEVLRFRDLGLVSWLRSVNLGFCKLDLTEGTPQAQVLNPKPEV